MHIDIRGFNPENLGSCLMLLAAQERLAAAFPRARITTALGTDDLRLARRHRERFGVLGRWPRRWKRLDVGWMGHVVPEGLQRAFSVTSRLCWAATRRCTFTACPIMEATTPKNFDVRS